MKDHPKDPRSAIPNINELAGEVKRRLGEMPPPMATRLARYCADELRRNMPCNLDERLWQKMLAPLICPGPTPVLNGTGILLHTNLGRAPLAHALVLTALEQVAGYTDLEFDLDSGKRGHRDRHFSTLAQRVWGVEDAILVNNAAAGVCLALAALSAGKEAIVSRGELIEIGGSFRLPEIMAQAGAHLVEVGTTNKTRTSDYQRALGANTGAMVKVHRSNFKLEGFTQEAPLEALMDLGRTSGVPVIMDLGSGLSQMAPFPAIDEPFIEAYLKQKPDVLIFSGDKLFGSIQGGVILGQRAALKKLRAHPLMRMLRLDKLSIAILCHALKALAMGHATPLSQLAVQSPEELKGRAQKLAAHIPGAMALDEWGFAGGGSLPAERLRSAAVGIRHPNPAKLAKFLRQGPPSLVGYIRDNMLRINLLTIPPGKDEQLAILVRQVLQSLS